MITKTMRILMRLTLLAAALAAVTPAVYAEAPDTAAADAGEAPDTAAMENRGIDSVPTRILDTLISVQQEPESVRKQGLLVITGDPDCRVLIDGAEKGRGERVFVSLPAGSYMVSGHREECFDDYEREGVEHGKVETVTVNTRAVRAKVDPPSYCAVISGERTLQGMGMGAGVWYKNHLFNPFFAVCSGSDWLSPQDGDSAGNREYGSVTVTTVGVHYLYNVAANNFAQFGIGISTAWGVQARDVEYAEKLQAYEYYDDQLGWTRDTAMQTVYAYSHTEDEFFSFGPRVAVQGGFEHVKLLVAGTYLIRSDAGGVVADPRNFYLLQAGITLMF